MRVRGNGVRFNHARRFPVIISIVRAGANTRRRSRWLLTRSCRSYSWPRSSITGRAVQPFKIFGSGSHVDISGARLDFAEADLRATAEAYDPALNGAPIVVGHPRHDAPAYGWVAGLDFVE